MESRTAIKQRSKELLKGNWGKAVVMALMVGLSVAVWIGASIGMILSGYILMGALFFILFVPVIIMTGAGVQYVFLDWSRQGKLANDWFKQMWQVFSDHRLAGKVIRVAYASAIFQELWEMIFVVPGVIKVFEYSQALFIMKDHYDNDENVTARQCLKESSLLMNGYKEDLFIFQLSYIGWQFLGMLPLFIGMLWVGPYMQTGMVNFYVDLRRERSIQPVTVFFPDGTDIEEDIKINNKVLTRANWIALVYELLLFGMGMALATFVPGVKTSIQNNTYLINMKDSTGENYKYYVKFYTDNEYKDNEIDSYIMLPANGREDQILWKTIENECKEKPVKYDQQMHQAYRKKIRYDVESDQLKLESKNGTITMFDLKVQNKGKKITGKYLFRTDEDDNGKVTMTRLQD